MTRFLELLTSVVIVAVLFVVVGLFLPDHRSVQHSTDTSHPLRQVYDTLNTFKHFANWNPLRQHDPKVQYELSGPDRGVGARLDYVSTRKEFGTGSWHITESEQDDHIKYTVYNDSYGRNKNHVLTFDQDGKIVQINWKFTIDYGWSLAGRYAGLYVDRTVGDDVKRSLANIGNLLASMPNFDYRNLDVQDTTIAPVNILYISTTADRNITAVENAMDVALKDIRSTIKANDLVESAPPRLITTNFGSDKYEFDVAIPVKRPEVIDPLAAPAQEPAAADEAAEQTPAEATAGAAPQAVDLTPPPALEGLKLPDNVHAGQSYGGRILMATYRGHPAALPLIRDQLRSYAAAYAEQVQDRPFEEYLTEIEETAAEDAQFRVYWPIK
ncbi:MAG: SRPBCC family protein [Xanthomonadales bacterium]|nr:SRPBCC family protein [Xanthomonadales bacterium]